MKLEIEFENAPTGLLVRLLRDLCGLSQDELADASGIARSTVRNAEDDVIGSSTPTVSILLVAMGVAVGRLSQDERLALFAAGASKRRVTVRSLVVEFEPEVER